MAGVYFKNEIINAGMVPTMQQGADASKPGAAALGALYLADDTQKLYMYNGGAWVVVLSAGSGTLTGADNGLGLAGTVVQLGGTLVEDTDIETTGAYQLTVNGSSVDAGYMQLGAGGTAAQFGFNNETGQGTFWNIADDLVTLYSGGGVAMVINLTSLDVVALKNSPFVATAFLQADVSGGITNVDAAAALAAKFINNGTALQNPANFNIEGTGSFYQALTNQLAGAVNVNNLLSLVFGSGTAPTNGKLYTAQFETMVMEFDASMTIPNGVVSAAGFDRLELTSTANATITVAQNAAGDGRALTPRQTQIYLPNIAAGVATTISHVAGLVSALVYQDPGTTNSAVIALYDGLLVPDSRELLVAGASITASRGVAQLGSNDANTFAGSMTFKPLANNSAANFLQANSAGLVTNVAAYTSGAEAAYAGTVTWTAGAAPSGSTTHTYSYNIVGNMVTVQVNLLYATPGTAATAVVLAFPSGLPAPKTPSGYTTNTLIGKASGQLFSALGVSATVTGVGNCWIGYNGTNYYVEGFFGSATVVGGVFFFTYITS